MATGPSEKPERNRRARPAPIQPAEARTKGAVSLYNEGLILDLLETYEGSATYDDLRRVLGVSVKTVSIWFNRYPAFRNRVEELRAAANDKVAASVFQRATGFEKEIVETSSRKEGDKTTKSENRKTLYYPPDPAMAKFWLSNRDRENWSDRKVIENESSYHELLRRAAEQSVDLPSNMYAEIEDAEEIEDEDE